MPYLWKELRDDEWSAAPLDGDEYRLAPDHEYAAPDEGAAGPDKEVLLLPSERNAGEWAVIGEPGSFYVNGVRSLLGLRALADRDEIRLPGGSRFYYSTERLAKIEPFPGAAEPTVCPRCTRPIDEGADAVRCPRCRVWHHEHPAAGRNCWTYSEYCAVCSNPTSLDADFVWTPCEL